MANALLFQSVPLMLWFKAVNDTVTDPYLDEEFHVRQAQQYCQNRFEIWDPKITTPPGLYLVSRALAPVLGCSISALRTLGIFYMTTILSIVLRVYTTRRKNQGDALVAQHSALNISLFPPLFFFSALYYTDVASTLSVLIFYWYFLRSFGDGKFSLSHTLILVLLGASSLLFRQTNIFWVAIFPAGLVLVNKLDRGHDVVKDSMQRGAEGFGDSMLSVARTSWKMDVVYDVSVRDAWFEDYIKTVISLATTSVRTLTRTTQLVNLITALSPYLTTLALFAAFIIYNGSVVLGDKTNHVATIHLTQMLYIWTYFTFFSWPLLYPYLSALVFNILAKLPAVSPLESMLMFRRRRLGPRLVLMAGFTVVACATVHFNTIVHPFILADNRHYTFYIFRLLLRPAWVRYAVTPIYVICGWACIQALGARSFKTEPSSVSASSSKTTSSEQTAPPTDRDRPLTIPDGVNSAKTSFVILWLATTSLQLITAPLVEPRYLILPWIFWRMHAPVQRYRSKEAKKDEGIVQSLMEIDERLWLESFWFAVIGVGTGYVFLNWGFEWAQEPGQVMRFMW